MMEKKNLILILFLIMALLIFSISMESYSRMDTEVQSNAVENVEEILEEPEKPEPIKIKIGAVGDIMTHGPQLRAQFDAEQNIYDFNNNYQHVKEYIEQCDLAICNIETVFAGEEKNYSSYPRFNTPDSLVDALYACGFDVGVTSNNHSMDKGKEGVLRTLQVIEDKGMLAVGTQLPDEQNYEIVDVKQIKIGIAAFTYETPEYQNHKTINGIMVPHEIEDAINTFNYSTLDEDLLKMDEIIENMKTSGAHMEIFYIHWGQEYSKKQNHYQEKIANHLANQGVEIIFGSHPHVIQPVEIIQTADGHETAVFYSLGNFISNQRYELLNNRYTEDGMIAHVEYLFEPDTNLLELQEVNIIPTWVNRYYGNHKRYYEILPIPQFMHSDILGEKTMWRLENSLKNTVGIIGKEYLNEETGKLTLLNNQ